MITRCRLVYGPETGSAADVFLLCRLPVPVHWEGVRIERGLSYLSSVVLLAEIVDFRAAGVAIKALRHITAIGEARARVRSTDMTCGVIKSCEGGGRPSSRIRAALNLRKEC